MHMFYFIDRETADVSPAFCSRHEARIKERVALVKLCTSLKPSLDKPFFCGLLWVENRNNGWRGETVACVVLDTVVWKRQRNTDRVDVEVWMLAVWVARIVTRSSGGNGSVMLQ